MRFKLLLAILVSLGLQTQAQEKEGMDEKHPDVHQIVVMEVLQTTSYTYVRGAEKNRVLWLAVPKMKAEKGEIYYFHGGMEMRNFKSKELKRTFPSVWFCEGLISPDLIKGKGKEKEQEEVVPIEAPPGAISIEELYQHRKEYENKVVLVCGKVSKFNAGIMRRNWIHLKDGSGNSGGNDLTVTSSETVNVGEVVILEGILRLGKDFGAGYYYELILEDGKIRQK